MTHSAHSLRASYAHYLVFISLGKHRLRTGYAQDEKSEACDSMWPDVTNGMSSHLPYQARFALLWVLVLFGDATLVAGARLAQWWSITSTR
jgi:hypothetical protein